MENNTTHSTFHRLACCFSLLLALAPLIANQTSHFFILQTLLIGCAAWLVINYLLSIKTTSANLKTKQPNTLLVPQSHQHTSHANGLFWLSLLTFTAWLLITVTWSPAFYASIATAFSLIDFLFACMIGYHLNRQPAFWPWLMRVLSMLVVLLTAIASYQVLWLHQAPKATFLQRNTLAAYLNLIWPLIVSYRFTTPFSKMRQTHHHPLTLLTRLGLLIKENTGSCLLLLCIAFTLGLCSSLGATLALLMGLSLFGYQLYRYRRQAPETVLLIAVIFIVGHLLASPFTNSYLLSKSQLLFNNPLQPHRSIDARLAIWQACLALWQHTPWYGAGVGSFQYRFPPFQLPLRDWSAGYFAHNDYLQCLIELGVPGLTLFVLSLVTGLRALTCHTPIDNSIQTNQRPESQESLLLLRRQGIAIALLTMLCHSAVTFLFYVPATLLLFAALLGYGLGVCRAPSQRPTLPVRMSTRGGATILASSVVLVYLLLAAMGGMMLYYTWARRALAAGELKQAYRYSHHATRLFPSARAYDSLALTELAALSLQKNPAQHLILIKQINQALTKAKQLNRCDPIPWQLAAKLIALTSKYLPARQQQQALVRQQQLLTKALQLDPRQYTIRLNYAQVLLQRGKPLAAKQLLESGLAYLMPKNYTKVSPYVQLLISLDRSSGNTRQASALHKHLTVLKEDN